MSARLVVVGCWRDCAATSAALTTDSGTALSGDQDLLGGVDAAATSGVGLAGVEGVTGVTVPD